MKKTILTFLTLATLLTIQSCNISGYSDGTRSGKLTKFSKKGILCKTYEGELMMGEAGDNNWLFSVKDETIAQELQNNVGKEMTLHYDQLYNLTHISCYSETTYVVNKITLD